MAMAKRILLFILTNILVMVTLNIVVHLIAGFFGVDVSSSQYGFLMMWCVVWGMGGAFISLLMSKFMAKWMMGVKIIDPKTTDPEQRDLVLMVENLARRARLPKMPEVGFYESPEINAFATGPSKSNSLVAVSSGLLRRMNKDEVEGVLGHEIAHIANGDMVTMTLIQGVVNAFTMFLARILSSVIASQVEERNRGMVRFLLTIVFDIVFTILGSIVVNYFSRLREFRADIGGAKFSSREKMIAALQKLQANFESQREDQNLPEDKLATLKISGRRGGFLALLSTHPELSDRIARLKSASI